jgi:hypothetical protein
MKQALARLWLLAAEFLVASLFSVWGVAVVLPGGWSAHERLLAWFALMSGPLIVPLFGIQEISHPFVANAVFLGGLGGFMILSYVIRPGLVSGLVQRPGNGFLAFRKFYGDDVGCVGRLTFSFTLAARTAEKFRRERRGWRENDSNHFLHIFIFAYRCPIPQGQPDMIQTLEQFAFTCSGGRWVLRAARHQPIGGATPPAGSRRAARRGNARAGAICHLTVGAGVGWAARCAWLSADCGLSYKYGFFRGFRAG